MTVSPELTAPVPVIGASSLDVKGRALDPLVPGTSNQGLIRSSMGGVGRLGVPTVLLSAVGADETGKRLLAQAADSGIDTRHVGVCLSALTAPPPEHLRKTGMQDRRRQCA